MTQMVNNGGQIGAILGPFHKHAKGCDQVIVRALDSHPKAVPWEMDSYYV